MPVGTRPSVRAEGGRARGPQRPATDLPGGSDLGLPAYVLMHAIWQGARPFASDETLIKLLPIGTLCQQDWAQEKLGDKGGRAGGGGREQPTSGHAPCLLPPVLAQLGQAGHVMQLPHITHVQMTRLRLRIGCTGNPKSSIGPT